MDYNDWPAFATARRQAHQAAQWLARAARANLPPEQDDGQTSLVWDAARRALLGQPLPGGLRIGLDVAALQLLAVGDGSTFALVGSGDADAGKWTDALLNRRGLAKAGGVALPYEIERAPDQPVDAAALAALSLWFGASAAALEALRAGTNNLRPGPGPVRLWPHHFDIATLIALEVGHAETARSVGVGVSMGDGYCSQPYVYASPWPRPDAARLPPAPRGGHWHTLDFVAVVASADELATLGGLEKVLPAFVAEAFRTARAALPV